MWTLPPAQETFSFTLNCPRVFPRLCELTSAHKKTQKVNDIHSNLTARAYCLNLAHKKNSSSSRKVNEPWKASTGCNSFMNDFCDFLSSEDLHRREFYSFVMWNPKFCSGSFCDFSVEYKSFKPELSISQLIASFQRWKVKNVLRWKWSRRCKKRLSPPAKFIKFDAKVDGVAKASTSKQLVGE